MNPAQIMPLAIPLVVVAIIALRARRERPLHPGRLWIAPVLVTVLIGLGLVYSPHPAFGLGTDAVLALAAIAGLGFGWWRAHATVLRHDPDTGRIMASQSNLAVAVLAGVFVLRMAARQALGTGAVIATDASMLFALGMVIALRVALWRRAKGLVPA
jgi:membrane protein CcdC involved in cytochrome C biogenesis